MMRSQLQILLTAALISTCSLCSHFAAAHPVSLSEANVDIHPDHAAVNLRVLVEDLYLYQELDETEEGYIPKRAISEAANEHKSFIARYFTIMGLNGKKFTGEFEAVVLQELPGKGVHISELMQFSVEYLMRFPMDTPPEYLTFLQQFGGKDTMMPASMSLRLRREGTPIYRPFMLTKDMPVSIEIDWDAEPPEPDASPEAYSAYYEKEMERKLGFGSYGAVYSFFYITDYEVRHEILIPLMTLESWLAIDRKDPAFIEVAEQEAAKDAVFEFFRDRNPVEIDGIEVQPALGKIVFYGLDFTDFARQAPEKRLSAYTARVGIILTYSTKGTPQTVKLTWEMFNEWIPALYSMIYAFDNTGQNAFTRLDPAYEWQNPGRDTPSAIASLEPPEPPRTLNDEEARTVFDSLLRNVYRAFDYRNESDVYDALDKSVGGDLLATLYLQIRKSLEMQEQGGAVSRIKHVRVVEMGRRALTSGEPAIAFIVESTWQVEGTVEHWGHIHTRTNQYRARFRVDVRDASWKITDMDVQEQKRVNFETRIRTMPS